MNADSLDIYSKYKMLNSLNTIMKLVGFILFCLLFLVVGCSVILFFFSPDIIDWDRIGVVFISLGGSFIAIAFVIMKITNHTQKILKVDIIKEFGEETDFEVTP